MSSEEEAYDPIKEAGEFAQLLMSDTEIAHLIGVPPQQVRVAITLPDSPLGKAIRNGRLRTTAELHRAQIDLAVRGSSAAQDAVSQLLRKVRN